MTEAAEFRCARCGAGGPRLAAPPMPGPVGLEVMTAVCAACHAEWERQEVMVINELRLNFMDPESGRILERAMREFLLLDPGERDRGRGPASEPPLP